MSEVTSNTIKDFVKTIMMYGLMPRVPDEWKGILPLRLQTEPIVWLAEGIYQGFETGRILQIDTRQLDKNRLFKLNLSDVSWWVYEGSIPPKLCRYLLKSHLSSLTGKFPPAEISSEL